MRSLEEIVAANAAVKPRQLFAIYWIAGAFNDLEHVCDSTDKAQAWVAKQEYPENYHVSPVRTFDLD